MALYAPRRHNQLFFRLGDYRGVGRCQLGSCGFFVDIAFLLELPGLVIDRAIIPDLGNEWLGRETLLGEQAPDLDLNRGILSIHRLACSRGRICACVRRCDGVGNTSGLRRGGV
jgi:hypothetical protein